MPSSGPDRGADTVGGDGNGRRVANRRAARAGVHGDLAAVVVQPRDPHSAVQGVRVELPDALLQDRFRAGLRQRKDEREAL